MPEFDRTQSCGKKPNILQFQVILWKINYR